MVKLIIDANILFAALIKESTTADLLCRKNMQFYTPQFIYEEFMLHKEEILQKTHRENVFFFLADMEKILHMANPDRKSFEQAQKIATDPKDTAYIALSIQLNHPIWSNDKRLKNCGVEVITTRELLERLR